MTSNITLKEDELEAILAEVERDLAIVLKSESDKLAKAQGDDADEDKGSSDEASAPAADAGAGEAPASAPPAGPEASSGPPEGSAPADSVPAPPAEGSASADPAQDQGGPMDVNALKGEYSQLPPEELKMHYVACKAALLEVMQGAGAGAGAGPEASAGGPPPGPSASPSPGPGAPPPPAMKGEMNAIGKPPMAKSESFSKSEADDLRAQIDGLTKAVTLVLTTPQRKAVTANSLAYLAKSEEKPADKQFTHQEAFEKLAEVTKDPKRARALSKSDKNLINQFCVGAVDVKSIEHLLK